MNAVGMQAHMLIKTNCAQCSSYIFAICWSSGLSNNSCLRLTQCSQLSIEYP
uniref:Uncharacterized protein n=1 Tax=Anguilla anguilla TaxID=7936 RepID=A0A0E9SBQ1_ANGAN